MFGTPSDHTTPASGSLARMEAKPAALMINRTIAIINISIIGISVSITRIGIVIVIMCV